MSDSSDLSSSDEDTPKHRHTNIKSDHPEDRATSKFYTKDESQEDLPYVADVSKNKKSKKIKFQKNSLVSKNQSTNKVNLLSL